MEEMPGMIRPDLQALFPACAGVIPSRSTLQRLSLSFPRLRGGDPNREGMQKSRTELFPACAGVILCSGSTRHRCATFPRLCGGDPNMKYYRVEVSAFSPPVRG